MWYDINKTHFLTTKYLNSLSMNYIMFQCRQVSLIQMHFKSLNLNLTCHCSSMWPDLKKFLIKSNSPKKRSVMCNPAGASVLTEITHLQWTTFLTKITLVAEQTWCVTCSASVGWLKDLGEVNSSLPLSLRSTLFATARPRGRKVVCQTELSVSARSGSSSDDLLDINIHVWTPKTRTLCLKATKTGHWSTEAQPPHCSR